VHRLLQKKCSSQLLISLLLHIVSERVDAIDETLAMLICFKVWVGLSEVKERLLQLSMLKSL